MPKRLSTSQRRLIREMLSERDGPGCIRCKALPAETPEGGLDIHHVDGDRERHDPDNLCLACHSCNQTLVWEDEKAGKPSVTVNGKAEYTGSEKVIGSFHSLNQKKNGGTAQNGAVQIQNEPEVESECGGGRDIYTQG